MTRLKIMGISGSLRTNSSATMVLKQVAMLLPSSVGFNMYSGLGELPHFNDAADEPATVKQFKNLVAAADGIFICSPEYAFGVPGTLKNALDWTVSSGEFDKKPVAALSASPTSAGGDKAHASLLLVLSALSARVVASASFPIPAIYKKISKTGAVVDPAIVDLLARVLADLKAEIRKGPPE